MNTFGCKLIFFFCAMVVGPAEDAICNVNSCSVRLQNASHYEPSVLKETCRFYDVSSQCVAFRDTFDWHAGNESVKSRSCSDEALVVNVSPWIFRPSKYPPVVKMNISLILRDAGTSIAFVQLKCLEEPHHTMYCGRNNSLIPCRSFDFRNAHSLGIVDFPVSFYFDCFGPMTDFSLFQLNISLYPQLCENSYLLRFPGLQHLEATNARDWLPMVMIDDSDESGVWIRFGLPPTETKIELIRVSIFDYSGTDPLRVEDITLNSGKSGVLFQDLMKGDYRGEIGAIHGDCYYDKCIPMLFKFTLDTDHLSKRGIAVLYFKSVTAPILLAVFAIVAMVVVGLAIFFLNWLRRKKRSRPIDFVRFEARPQVFILYTDDNDAHRSCVLRLADYLQNTAHCDVIIDEWQFRSHHVDIASNWLFASLNRADYYLILFSEASRHLLEQTPHRIELRPRRPFAEVFLPGLEFVLRQIAHDMSAASSTNLFRHQQFVPATSQASYLRRYVCVAFDYSFNNEAQGSQPNGFGVLKQVGCPSFQLPRDLRALICHLHKVLLDTVNPHSPLYCDQLNECIQTATDFHRNNPSWLHDRISTLTTNLEEENIQSLSALMASLEVQNLNNAIDDNIIINMEPPNNAITQSRGDSGIVDNEQSSSTVSLVHNGVAKRFPLVELNIEEQEEGEPLFPLLPMD